MDINENYFSYNNKLYTAKETTSGCEGCAFYKEKFCELKDESITGCFPDARKDKKYIIWIE